MFRKDTKTECCGAEERPVTKAARNNKQVRFVPRSARQQNSVRRHDGSNHQERERRKPQTERMQISREFPSASNDFTHCWADTQNSLRQNSLVDNTVNSFTHLQSVHGILSTGHVDKVHVVLRDSRHNQQVKQLEKRVGMSLANSCQQRNRENGSASWIELK